MVHSTDQNTKIRLYIDRYLKHSIDGLIDKLTTKFNCEFSAATELEMLNLSLEYISRMQDVIVSENLEEPEDFFLSPYK